MYVILHQVGFLLTGLCTTLGVQWLFYRGAASMDAILCMIEKILIIFDLTASMSLLPQLSNYIGMLLVGFFIPVLLKRKLKYKPIQQGDDVRCKIV